MSEVQPSSAFPSSARDEFRATERQRLMLTQRRALAVAITANAIMMLVALVIRDPRFFWPPAIGSVGFVGSYVCVRRGLLGASQFLVILTTIALVTNAALHSGGLSNPATLAYPVIIIWAGLNLRKRWFFASVASIVASIVAIVANSAFGWIPASGTTASLTRDLIVATVILMATAYAVWLLAETARDSLETAYLEIDRRRAIERDLQELSSRDSLTGVYNRRFFDAELQRLERSREYPISIVVADVDELKLLNDRSGHAQGDRLLVETARVLASAVRAEDVLARIGGDEFSLLLPNTDAAAAERTVDRVKEKLRDLPSSDGTRLSLSLGVATSTDGRLEDAWRLADSRMYASKAAHKARRAPSSAGPYIP